MDGLTASKENYLKAIATLTQIGDSTCITEIAKRMHVKKASASYAVSNLEKMGLILRPEGRRVILTAEGKKQAALIINRFEVIRIFYIQILKTSKELSDQEACKLEHLLSQESLAAMQCMITL